MTDLHDFNPDWCLAPAACLQEWLDEHAMTPASLAHEVEADLDSVRGAEEMILQVLRCEPLTREHALLLSAGTGVSVRFWENYERYYRDGLAADLEDVTQDHLERRQR